VNYDPDSEDFIPDEDTPLGRPAKSKSERRTTLDWCLQNPWRNKDAGCIERTETSTRSGWKMYTYRAGG
jgi:hypothetical protein